MAAIVPALNQCLRRMTSGERRFAERLSDKLEGDYRVWYEVPIGGGARHPDFILLHPRRGVWVLEVKDWRLSEVISADKLRCRVRLSSGERWHHNPLEQARAYVLEIVRLLEKDPQLIAEGKLCLRWGYGAVLPNISRRDFEQSQLDRCISPDRVICRDEMLEAEPADRFQERLWSILPPPPKEPLSLPQLDRVRAHPF